RLLRNRHNGRFADVSESARLTSVPPASGLTFVDYDHDGDLDLYLTRSAAGLAEFEAAKAEVADSHGTLLRNNGNGTFTDVTEETGLGSRGGVVALASDVNNDRAVDFVITGGGSAPAGAKAGSAAGARGIPPAGTKESAAARSEAAGKEMQGRGSEAPQVFLNPREGKFWAAELWAAAMPAPTVAAVALDFNKDGWMDLAFTHSGAPGVSLWRNVEGKKFERVALPELHLKRGFGVAAFDYDNDGWVDLAVAGESESGGGVRLLRNAGPQGFKDVSAEVGLDKLKLNNPRALLAVDYDNDGASDLLITQHDGPPVLLRNEGGAKNGSVRLALKGLNDNKSALGTKVEVFAGPLWQKFEVSGSGYMGQSVAPPVAGLGSAGQADIVRLLWPTGVVQDEVEFERGGTVQINEIDRRGSSCPIVFVWDGTRYRFIADMIGAGVIGHWIAPGQRNMPDPTEYMKVAGALVRPRRGRLSFRLMEPMEEAVYLDQVRLLAVDHPRDAQAFPNEYF
ncbi:MAG TPA: CRTAC1 family protein, partial [Phycisphaerae bacterium]